MNLDRVIALRNQKTLYREGDTCVKVFNEDYSKADVLNEALNQARVEETGLNIPRVLGVNMVETVPAEIFKAKASEVVRQALTKGKPVVMISMFMYYSEYDEKRRAKDAAYNKAYKAIFEEQKCDNLYFIDGKQILNDWTFLTFDLLHPSPNGHLEMGKRIADKIRDEFHLL